MRNSSSDHCKKWYVRERGKSTRGRVKVGGQI
jgi:hypothetical protein